MVPSGTSIPGCLGLLRQRAFVWFRRKAVVKEKNKTIKSICLGNVNTACWVAVHLVGKMHLSLGERQAQFPPAAVSVQAGHPGPKATRGWAPSRGLWMAGSSCSWFSAIVASPTSLCPFVRLPAPQGHSENRTLLLEASWES